MRLNSILRIMAMCMPLMSAVDQGNAADHQEDDRQQHEIAQVLSDQRPAGGDPVPYADFARLRFEWHRVRRLCERRIRDQFPPAIRAELQIVSGLRPAVLAEHIRAIVTGNLEDQDCHSSIGDDFVAGSRPHLLRDVGPIDEFQ